MKPQSGRELRFPRPAPQWALREKSEADSGGGNEARLQVTRPKQCESQTKLLRLHLTRTGQIYMTAVSIKLVRRKFPHLPLHSSSPRLCNTPRNASVGSLTWNDGEKQNRPVSDTLTLSQIERSGLPSGCSRI